MSSTRTDYEASTSFPTISELHKYYTSPVEDQLRKVDTRDLTVKEAIIQGMKNAYADRVLDYKRGALKPSKARTFLGAVRLYCDYFEGRHRSIIKKLQTENARGELNLALMPMVFTAPHPTQEDEKQFLNMFDDDGIIGKDFKKEYPTWNILPAVSYQKENKKSLVMISCVVIENE